MPSQLARAISNYHFSVININCKYKRVLVTFYAIIAKHCQSISEKWYIN